MVETTAGKALAGMLGLGGGRSGSGDTGAGELEMMARFEETKEV